MFVMNESEWRAFILSGTRTGKLATTRADGRPHVVPIWFVMDGETLVFTSGQSTVKTKNLIHNPQATLCIDDENYPYAFVVLECDAAIEALSPSELLPYATEIAQRYVAADRAQEFGRRNAVEGEVLIRLTPYKVIPWGGMSE